MAKRKGWKNKKIDMVSCTFEGKDGTGECIITTKDGETYTEKNVRALVSDGGRVLTGKIGVDGPTYTSVEFDNGRCEIETHGREKYLGCDERKK